MFETLSLLSGADTRLDLYSKDAVTLLASNDDRSAGDRSSRIAYTPAQNGALYLRCTRKADGHTYGSYNLMVSGRVPSDVLIALPGSVTLSPLAPNPFNPATAVALSLPREAETSLRVYSSSGRLVRILAHGERLPAGAHTFRWDGRDDAGRAVSSGVYWVQLEALHERLVRRAVLIR